MHKHDLVENLSMINTNKLQSSLENSGAFDSKDKTMCRLVGQLIDEPNQFLLSDEEKKVNKMSI